MAEYEFECRNCKKIFTLFMRISERLKVKIKCPGCGSPNVEALMQAFTCQAISKCDRRGDRRAIHDVTRRRRS